MLFYTYPAVKYKAQFSKQSFGNKVIFVNKGLHFFKDKLFFGVSQNGPADLKSIPFLLIAYIYHKSQLRQFISLAHT